MVLVGDSSAVYIQQVEDVHISHGSIASQLRMYISLMVVLPAKSLS